MSLRMEVEGEDRGLRLENEIREIVDGVFWTEDEKCGWRMEGVDVGCRMRFEVWRMEDKRQKMEDGLFLTED